MIDPSKIELLEALALGFAFAGLLASGFELLVRRPVTFRLLQTGGFSALASVPVLVFSAPFVIIRNTVQGRRRENRTVGYVMLATVVAGFWCLLSGRIVLDMALLLTGA